jgi:transcriptional regulator with XRE-family HTH domain
VTVDSEALSVLLDKDGWRHVDFAKAVGISPQYLSDVLSGRSKLARSPELISAMARQLNVPRSMIEARRAEEVAS